MNSLLEWGGLSSYKRKIEAVFSAFTPKMANLGRSDKNPYKNDFTSYGCDYRVDFDIHNLEDYSSESGCNLKSVSVIMGYVVNKGYLLYLYQTGHISGEVYKSKMEELLTRTEFCLKAIWGVKDDGTNNSDKS